MDNHFVDHEVDSCSLENFVQLDGNVSISESLDSSYAHSDNEELLGASSSPIPVLVSSRSSSSTFKEPRFCFNKTILRNNKSIEALNLPTFTVYNMRSLWSKINCLAEDIVERSVDISFLSEVWEKKENL